MCETWRICPPGQEAGHDEILHLCSIRFASSLAVLPDLKVWGLTESVHAVDGSRACPHLQLVEGRDLGPNAELCGRGTFSTCRRQSLRQDQQQACVCIWHVYVPTTPSTIPPGDAPAKHDTYTEGCWLLQVTLAGFRAGLFEVLVATDVAARGLDISGVDLVVQSEPSKDPETYIHR